MPPLISELSDGNVGQFKYVWFMGCLSFCSAFRSAKLSLRNENRFISWRVPVLFILNWVSDIPATFRFNCFVLTLCSLKFVIVTATVYDPEKVYMRGIYHCHHPDSYPMGTGGFSPVIKRQRCEAGHSPQSSTEVNNRGAVPKLLKHKDQFIFFIQFLVTCRRNVER
jgi:hypothetical protein